MKKINIFYFIYLLMTCLEVYAEQTKLLSIDIKQTQDKPVEIALFLTDRVEYNTFILTAPDRLIIDLKNTFLEEKLPLSSEALLYVKKIRSAARNQHDLRVVFDLNMAASGKLTLSTDYSNEKQLLISLSANQNNDALSSENKRHSLEPEIAASADNSESPGFSKQLFSDWEISGKVSVENLGFFHPAIDSQQHRNYVSGAIEPEIYREWDDGKQSFTLVPFFRYSQYDNRRTHFDIRELTWLLAEDDWELRVGFRKVFWGVAEGIHLVDIINQTDLVENTDTEDKLGQPMINLALIRDWGTVDLFVLPGFRERTFPGKEGRLRTFPEIDVGNAIFEKHGIEKHLAFAARWSHAIGNWDIGLSHFYGTGREPSFKLKVTPQGTLELRPFYEIINQTGLDIQLTDEDWLWKHEAIVRSGQEKAFYASTTGLEYTFFDLFRSGLDLGIVIEYMYDSRGSNNFLAPFQDDILTALRFAFNDVQSTEILAGVLFDRTNNSKFYNIEASRRMGDSFTLDLEIRLYSGIPKNDPVYSFREDDHIRLELGYHF